MFEQLVARLAGRGGNVRPVQRAEAVPAPQPQSSSVGRPITSYEAASLSARLSPWRPNRAHINAILAGEGPLLRARSRQVIANSPYGANASETFVAYATGTGITPSSGIADEATKQAVNEAWTEWTDEADADGLTDFYGLQSLAARALFDAGEVFVRFRPRLMDDGLSVPLQLQLYEAEQLDESYTATAANGNQIRCGIEFGPIGNRVAYHFWQVHPGDATVLLNQGTRIRVPAENVLHLYKPLRPGQIRGRPWLTAGMVKLHDLDEYEDAELTRKKSAAMLMAFVTQGLNDDDSVGPRARDPDSDPGTLNINLEPGLAHILPEGADIKFNQAADVGPNFEAFMFRSLMAVCAAMGLPYYAVTGDTSKANYSSLRASLVEVRRRIEQFQWETLIFQMCRPVWRRWLSTAVLAGAVRLPGFARNPRPFLRVAWMTPKWDWVDPLKDAQAEKLLIDAGIQARSDAVRARGEDPEALDARIAADHEREKRLGISFPVGFSRSPDKPAGADIAPTGSDVEAGAAAEAAA